MGEAACCRGLQRAALFDAGVGGRKSCFQGQPAAHVVSGAAESVKGRLKVVWKMLQNVQRMPGGMQGAFALFFEARSVIT